MLEPSLFATERLRPLKRVEYERMIELGVLEEDERVELLDGMLVAVSPQSAAHAYVVQRLDALLHQALGSRTDVAIRIQLPLALGDQSEPEPDAAVVPAADYSRAHPSRALLVVEVAHDSANRDRRWKSRIYADGGIPAYWLIDIKQRIVEVFTEPGGEGYGRVERHRDDAILQSTSVAGLEFRVADLLPPA